MIRRAMWLLPVLLSVIPGVAAGQADTEALKMASGGRDGLPRGWVGGPPGKVFLDSAVVHGAPYSARMEGFVGSEGEFTYLAIQLPSSWSGDTLTLVGWMKTTDVTGLATLGVRQEGQRAPLLGSPVTGTTDWTRYTVSVPVMRTARAVYLVAMLRGPGTAWLDDVELRVDGRPAEEAPARKGYPAEADHQFDAGSGIASQPLSPVQVRNLAELGMVWGFVKYHHPRVARGELNWDYELFRVLPAVLQAKDRPAANAVLAAWLARVGDPGSCSPCAQAPTAPQLPADLAWSRDRGALGADLAGRMAAIYQARPAAGERYYIGKLPPGNPDFGSEASTPVRMVSDAGFRLLALFRFWNIVQYWHPDRDLIGEDWKRVLPEFIPRLMAADDSVGYRLAMLELIARVNDTHANLWSGLAVRAPRGSAQVPVALRFLEGHAVVSGLVDPRRWSTPLELGDVIERVDGQSVDSLVRAWRPQYAASNEPTRLRDMAAALLRGEPGPARLTVRRAGRSLDLATQRIVLEPSSLVDASRHERPGDAFQMLSDEVAYLKLSTTKVADVAGYFRRAAGTRVLVLDNRGYPSDFPLMEIGGRLVERPTPFVHFTLPDLANPGAFVWGPELSLQPIAPHYTGRVVILVDEVTQSSAEYHSMAYRAAPGAIVVGSTTAGADGNVSSITLPGGLRTMITGLGVFYPDRRTTQRIGIVPDLEVHPTIEGIRAGRDEVLEAAVSRALGRKWHLPAP